ncbi:MAG: exodeoxyribonuclease VII large subunit [Lachnospiraceae bacterium]|nr:exodeoxyribonuclease VII large subunit [Lachnospiraceae bacterium]
MFTQDFMMNRIYVKGEVSNCKYHTSGHIYFTLKDETGALNAVLFAGNRRGLAFSMKNGDNVIVLGSISVYERDGKYQLYAREILPDGEGLLYQRFEKLKRELEEMGMFALEYKQPIPKYIQTLGVVTASTGAAIRDIQNISSRRNPYLQIILYPALVQGEGAAISIVNGIRALEQLEVDLMIVGRGGGSMEDLWAFNEEIVARAIFECHVPIISAVGHETDTTISDYVADLRAPTPSAAAELAVCDIREVEERILAFRLAFNRGISGKLEWEEARLRQYENRLKLLSPRSQLNEKRQMAVELEEKLQMRMEHVLTEKKHKMALTAERLESLSPAKKLSQGYAFVADETGRGICDAASLKVGDRLNIRMLNGKAAAEVVQVETES